MPRLASFAQGNLRATNGSVGSANGYPLLGWTTEGANSNGRRSFDIAKDHMVTVTRSSSTNYTLNLFNNWKQIGQGDGTSTARTDSVASTARDGVDTQGWYQLEMTRRYIGFSRPQATSFLASPQTGDIGSLDLFTYDDGGNLAFDTYGNTSSGINFQYYKIAWDNTVANNHYPHMISQFGYVGDIRSWESVNLNNGVPTSGGDFGVTSSGNYTRGIACLTVGSSRVLTVGGRVGSGNQMNMNLQTRVIGGGTSGTSYSITGDSAETARHVRMAERTDGRVFIYHAGTNAGVQIYNVTPSTIGQSGTRYIVPALDLSVNGSIGAWQNQVVINGVVYAWSDATTLEPVQDLLAPFNTTASGLTRINDQIIAVGANNGRIYVFENDQTGVTTL